MIVEYNKFNIILYFLIGTTITFATRRFIYGGMIILLSALTLSQYLILQSDNPFLTKYQNVTGLFIPLMVIILVLTSLFILVKSSIKGTQKLFSILFIVLSIGFSFYKKYFKDKPIFKNQITNYIASLLLMISLMAVSIIPDNQFILEKEYTNIKNKLTN